MSDSNNQVRPNWDKIVDVIVAGYGGAGASAAITAHDGGAEVLILESAAQGGGNTLVSFGGFLCPENAPEAIEYISALYDFSHSERDDDLIRVFARESVKNIDWLKSLKPDLEVQAYGGAGFPQVKGAGSMKKYLVKGMGKGASTFAHNLWHALTHGVRAERKIPVWTETPVKKLVQNAKGEIAGVIAESKGKEIAVQAKRAVILTTGGYEFDAAALQNNVKGYPIYASGHPGNRGDGVRMAQKVGAKLWHMNGASCGFGLKVPDFEAAFLMLIGPPGHVFVDKHGRRFINERAIEGHAGLLAVDFFDAHSLEYPRIPFYVIFDEAVRKKGVISPAAGLGAAGAAYTWSKDNLAEIDQGWIIKAETLAELERSLKIKSGILEQTISKWNSDVRAGQDALFGREIPKDNQSLAIERPPFYALEIYPCLINTQGGPRRNEKAQIIDAFGDPIPRLYSAGELGSMWGLLYQGGGNIAESMVFGRIAGKNAAGEKPLGW